jgi:hypothetical protein
MDFVVTMYRALTHCLTWGRRYNRATFPLLMAKFPEFS